MGNPKQVTRQANDLPQQPPSKKTKNSGNLETPAQNMHVMSGRIKLTNLRTVEKIIEVPENTRNIHWEDPRDCQWNISYLIIYILTRNESLPGSGLPGRL